MKLKIELSMAAVMLIASGCFGGEGDDRGIEPPPPPPPPPPPAAASVGGLWIGDLISELNDGVEGPTTTRRMRGLVAETGEFRWLLDDPSQQIFGTFRVEGTDLRLDEFPVWATENPENFGDFAPLGGTVDERVSLSGSFQSSWGFEEHVGTFSLAYDELYERDSSLEALAGIYTSTSDTLTIDEEGVLFYQSSANSCVGNGSAELIDPDFNMYRVAILVDSCVGNEAARNGFTLTGLAYLADSGDGAMNDVLEFASSVTISEAAIPFDAPTHQFIWNLRTQR